MVNKTISNPNVQEFIDVKIYYYNIWGCSLTAILLSMIHIFQFNVILLKQIQLTVMRNNYICFAFKVSQKYI